MTQDSLGTLTPFSARVYGIAIILAPLLLLASTIAYLTEGEGINDGVLGGTIGVWAVFALAIAFVGILRLLEPRAPRAAPLLTVIALIGCAAGLGFNLEATYIALLPDFSIEAVEAAQEGSDAISIFTLFPWGLFLPLAFVLTGVVMWRTRTIATWSSILLIASGILFVSARPARIDALAVISDLVIVAALVPIGWAMFTGARIAPTAPSRVETAVP